MSIQQTGRLGFLPAPQKLKKYAVSGSKDLAQGHGAVGSDLSSQEVRGGGWRWLQAGMLTAVGSGRFRRHRRLRAHARMQRSVTRCG